MNIFRRRRREPDAELDATKRKVRDQDERIRRLRELKAVVVIRHKPHRQA